MNETKVTELEIALDDHLGDASCLAYQDLRSPTFKLYDTICVVLLVMPSQDTESLTER